MRRLRIGGRRGSQRLNSPDYTPEGRPIASREHALSKIVAGWLANTGLSPNAISIAGMVCAILGGVALGLTSVVSPAWPLFLFGGLMMQMRLLANMFDGMVAIQTAKASPVGALYNEIPDRVSDAAFFIGMGYALGGCSELGYLAAILAIMTAYIRSEGKVAGAHQEFCGPLAKPERMGLSTAAAVLAAITPTTWLPKFDWAPGAEIMAGTLLLIAVGSFATCLRRLGKIASALRGRSA